MYTKILSLFLILFLFITGCGPSSTKTKPAPAVTLPPPIAPTSPAATNTPPAIATATSAPVTYPLVDTGQGKCYDDNAEIPCPTSGAFFGQDAQYTGLKPSFSINSDATVTDKNTGLIWQQSPDVNGDGTINSADKLAYAAAGDHCKSQDLAGQKDWRLPDIKTLNSLMDYRGTDPVGASGATKLIPFLDSTYFSFAYGDTAVGELTTEAQFASSSLYVNTGSAQGTQAFAANFADGRLKSYPLSAANGTQMKFFVLCVRGNQAYGANHFVDNGDETISDQATGLVWQKADSAKGLNWQAALAYCEGLSLAGKDDWRLPDTKSLQSLVDYSRSPATSNSAAIDALFSVTDIKNEAGKSDYPFYWTSTTHANFNGTGAEAAYIAFGQALGYVSGAWMDINGAGAQSSDPKSGDTANYPYGRGSQGEAVRILNYARCVRGGNITLTPAGNPGSTLPAMTDPVTLPPAAINTPAGGENSPSPESIAACSTSSVGQACQFSLPLIGTIDGTCTELINDQITHLVACLVNVP